MSKSGLCGLDALDSMELLLSKKGMINEIKKLAKYVESIMYTSVKGSYPKT